MSISEIAILLLPAFVAAASAAALFQIADRVRERLAHKRTRDDHAVAA